eukprot:TRINITY_DN2601_c0_g1_i1.p1 TRINITY_DN2601_c0_g1~~TRINITY_DN2601_c0_g1_i1.p1  ORF type:complete len:268 (-),score=118.44 TRINITY_DN2601_c0_g1_i1:9-812(-)
MAGESGDEDTQTWIFLAALSALIGIFVIIAIFKKTTGGKLTGSKVRVVKAAPKVYRKKGSQLLIAGPSQAGKTALFGQLVHHTFVPTLTSINENIENSVPVHDPSDEGGRAKNVTIVDFPGHNENRHQLMNSYVPQAKAILFVIDSVNEKIHKQGAQFLYDILIHPYVHKLEIPVAICCNKTDMHTALSTSDLQNYLERELNVLRQSKSSAPGIEGFGDDDDDEKISLGYDGEAFKFDQLPFTVDFLPVSAKASKIDAISEFVYNQF